MAGKISEDLDKAVDGTEKVAAAAGGNNYGILISSIATYLATLAQTLTGKTINAASNTISNITTAMFAANVIDIDGTLAANSDTRIASQKALKTYADALIASNDAMVFKGVTDCSASPNYPAADRGHTYRVSVAGKIGGASGVVVEAGDMFICLTDGTVSGDQAAVGASWSIIQANVDGAVIGPASAIDNAVARFDGASGKLIQDSVLLVADTTGALSRSGGGGVPIQATNTNDNAASGDVGYQVTSGVVTTPTLTSGISTNVTSIVLPSGGDWILFAGYSAAGAGGPPSVTDIWVSMNTVTGANVNTAGQSFRARGWTMTDPVTSGSLGPWRVSVPAGGTYYLNTAVTYTGGTFAVNGIITAQRPR